MYEELTYEGILKRMLEKIPQNIDKREGSIIYDALAPAAIEIKQMYIELQEVLNESFADSQSREFLIRRCAERGIIPYPATSAIRRGEFNISVSTGKRFSLGGLTYIIKDQINSTEYELLCETAGNIGNLDSGTLIPVEYIEGLETAVLGEVLIPGTDEEETEHLRKRYFESLKSQAFGGNIADYKEKTMAITGVGAVKIEPVWNGGGTVKLVIINSQYKKPSDVMIENVQNVINNTAPIGHVVSVFGASEFKINIKTNITFESGWDWDSILPYAEQTVDDYFNELSQEWMNDENIVVRISQIETRFLNLNGVLDVGDTTLNGETQNLIIDGNSIPVAGSIGVVDD